MMNARRHWLLVIGVGFACLAMGRGAEADLIYGATSTVTLDTQGGPFDGQFTDRGILTAEEARTASNTYSVGGAFVQIDANASARVDATGVDPVSRRPIIDFAGHAFASATGYINTGEAIADMKFTDVVSLRPRTGVTPDPNYAPGVQPHLYFHVEITGSITNLIVGNLAPTEASAVILRMNGGQQTSILAETDPTYRNYPDGTRWIARGNWDPLSLTVDGRFDFDGNVGNTGNIVGSATFSAPYDSSVRGYPYALETILQADADEGTAYIAGPHSVHLVGITYADGTTPESHGYQIVDLTGFPSPNLATAVPEPSSLQLAGLSLALLALNSLAHRLRRGRVQR
jgi:hypothetical protein